VGKRSRICQKGWAVWVTRGVHKRQSQFQMINKDLVQITVVAYFTYLHVYCHNTVICDNEFYVFYYFKFYSSL